MEYRKKISSNYNQLRLSDTRSLEYATAGFTVPTSGFEYWQITDLNNTQKLATKYELEYFYNHLFEELDRKDFFKVDDKKGPMAHTVPFTKRQLGAPIVAS